MEDYVSPESLALIDGLIKTSYKDDVHHLEPILMLTFVPILANGKI